MTSFPHDAVSRLAWGGLMPSQFIALNLLTHRPPLQLPLDCFSCFASPPATGNFPTVTRVLLSKIPPVDGRMTYVYDEYVVSCIYSLVGVGWFTSSPLLLTPTIASPTSSSSPLITHIFSSSINNSFTMS